MEPTEDDEDLVLARASANLLADLEQDLPKLLWKRSRPHEIKNHRRVHTHVKRRDRGHIINLVFTYRHPLCPHSLTTMRRLSLFKASRSCWTPSSNPSCHLS